MTATLNLTESESLFLAPGKVTDLTPEDVTEAGWYWEARLATGFKTSGIAPTLEEAERAAIEAEERLLSIWMGGRRP